MPWDSSLGRWWAKLTIGTLQSAYAAQHAHAPGWRSALAGDAYRYFFNNLEYCTTQTINSYVVFVIYPLPIVSTRVDESSNNYIPLFTSGLTLVHRQKR